MAEVLTNQGHRQRANPLGGAIGSAVARAAEALRRGVKWVVDRAKIHKPPAAA